MSQELSSGWRDDLSRLTFFRVFLVIWGSGVTAISLHELPKDIHFRRDGVETTGHFTGHTGVAGAKGDQGILTYTVAGQRHQLVSLQGSGIYKIGSTAQIYYLPSDPSSSREASHLLFDILGVCLGIVAFTIAATVGKILKRFA
jgi:hypothetical protein